MTPCLRVHRVEQSTFGVPVRERLDGPEATYSNRRIRGLDSESRLSVRELPLPAGPYGWTAIRPYGISPNQEGREQ